MPGSATVDMGRSRLLPKLIAIAVAIGCLCQQAQGQDFLWDGSNNDNFQAPPNWAGNNVPSGSVLASIIFGPEVAGNHRVNGHNLSPRDITQIRFTGATGAYNILGSGSFSFIDGGGVLNDSGFAQTINVDLVGAGESLVLDALGASLVIGGAVDLADSGGVTLNVFGANDVTIAGVISGVGGQLVKNDAGTLFLNAANTFTGPVTINGGTLQLNGSLPDAVTIVLADVAGATLDLNGNDETIGTLTGGGDLGGDVLLGAARLTISGAVDATFAGIISGTGGLTLDGTGSLELTGNNTFTGATLVTRGNLILNGAIGGDVTVQGQGLLSGNGSLAGDLLNRAGGIVSPGNSIGVLTVGGDYVQEAGSVLAVELSGIDGASDRLVVNGAATLHAGSTIRAGVSGEEFISNGDTFTIITATGGIVDQGALIEPESATLDFLILREAGFADGHTVFRLEIAREDDAYSDGADSENNDAIGEVLDTFISLAEGDPTGDIADLLAQLDALDPVQFNLALSQMTPEVYNAVTQIGINDTRRFMAALSSHLRARRAASFDVSATRSPVPGRALAGVDLDPRILASALVTQGRSSRETPGESGWKATGEFFGGLSDLDTELNRTGYTADAYGVQVRLDRNISSNLLAGLALEYADTNADLNEDRGLIDVETLRIGPYLDLSRDRAYVLGSLSIGFNSFDVRRDMPVLGRRANADYDGYDLTGFIEAGRAFNLGEQWSLTPNASLRYAYFDYDGFTESGAAAADLRVPSRDADSLQSRIGITVSGFFPQSSRELRADFFAGWEHEFLDDDSMLPAFDVGGSPFLTMIGSREKDAVYFGGGVTGRLGANTTGYVRTQGSYADSASDVVLVAGLAVRF